MNGHVLRALARDAYYQVVDNWVFRILAWLTLLPVLASFVIGLREDGLVILFGLKSWSYAELLGSLEGAGQLAENDPQGFLIEIILRILFQYLAGSFGILIALAATASFVPHLLEKGSAELLFHRPVSRTALFLSRYVAGLLFIAAVSTLLVVGMYLGLRIASQHDDPGILVVALSLTYVFALVYSFSMLVGVLTRSTVASILLASMFFLFNGCIHAAWILKQQHTDGPNLRVVHEESAAEDAEVVEAPPKRPEGVAGKLTLALDVLHAVLPKTTDADHLARKLRDRVQPPAFRDPESLVALARIPRGFTGGTPPTLAGALHERFGRSLAAWTGEGDASTVTCSLWRRPAEKSVTRFGDRERERTETSTQAASALQDLLEADGTSRDVARESMRINALGDGGTSASLVRWVDTAGVAPLAREALVFRGASDTDQILVLLVEAEGEPSPDLATQRKRFSDQLALDVHSADEWYADQLSFTSPWPYNTAWSLGSSLLFVALVLGLGSWRVSRIPF